MSDKIEGHATIEITDDDIKELVKLAQIFVRELHGDLNKKDTRINDEEFENKEKSNNEVETEIK